MKHHGLDAISLVTGLLFAVVGALFLFTDLDGADISVRWVWPLPVIALGLLMLAVGDRQDPTPDEPLPRGESADELDLDEQR